MLIQVTSKKSRLPSVTVHKKVYVLEYEVKQQTSSRAK